MQVKGIELKPCKCKKEMQTLSTFGKGGREIHIIHCESCDFACMPGKTEKEAAENWNNQIPADREKTNAFLFN